MKIGVNSRVYQQENTGIPYYVKSLYESLLSNKNDQYVFFQTRANKVIGLTKTLKLIKSKESNLQAVLFDLLLINRLIRAETGIEIFHGTSNILPLFKKPGIKYVVTIHDLSFLLFPKNHGPLFNLYYKYAIKSSLRIADVVVSDSYSTKNDIQRFYNTPEEKIKVVHLGVNNIFYKKTKKKRLIKAKYFFSICTHTKRKNILSVLEVFATNKDLLKFKYVIAGSMPPAQIDQLKNKINDLGLQNRTIIFGYASENELVNLYQYAEFFIYPSFYEGFGFPVLEAMISKCPVISSNNSSLVEVNCGERWLVDPNSLSDISEKISKMVTLTKKGKTDLIDKNYTFAKKFTWDETSRKMRDIFNNV